MKSALLSILLLLLWPIVTQAQVQPPPVPRIEDFNAIGWFTYEGDHKLGDHFELHTEYQARRAHLVTDWQQSLLRAGLAYKVMPRLKVSAGYAWVVTHPYGTHQLASGGSYPEQRFYEDISLTDQVGWALLTQRLRIEQRYIGIVGASGPLKDESVWSRQNRIRYLLRIDFPLQGPTLDDNEFYLATFNEAFVSFGRFVDLNVFDQNRVAVGLGYRASEDCRLELQYLNQILQHPGLDRSSKLAVFEFNHGFRLGLTYNIPLIEGKGGPAAGEVQE